MNKSELSKAEARQLAMGLIDYAEGRVQSLDEIERELGIGECGESVGSEQKKTEDKPSGCILAAPPLSNEHSPIISPPEPREPAARERAKHFCFTNYQKGEHPHPTNWPDDITTSTKLFELMAAFALAYSAELRGELDKAQSGRKHTQSWYAAHYGRLEDWARKILPEPYCSQFFSCIANGTYDAVKDVGEPYLCQGGFMVTPGGYIKFSTAQEQILHDQSTRAEASERSLLQARKDVAHWKANHDDQKRRKQNVSRKLSELIKKNRAKKASTSAPERTV